MMNPYESSSMEITLPIDYIGMTKEMQTVFESLIDDTDNNINEYESSTLEAYLTIYTHANGLRNFNLTVYSIDADGDAVLKGEFEPDLTPIEEEFYYCKAFEQISSNYNHY